MPITEADIEKIARLAHLDMDEEERRGFTPQMAAIVAYVEQLNELDTAAIEPAIGGLTAEGERTETTRQDVTERSLGQELALSEAPDAAFGYFRVPKVL